MEVSEIAAWIDEWFEPTFGEAEAQARFGVAADPTATIVQAVPADKRFRDVVFERTQRPAGFLSGVQLTLKAPETIRWDQVVERYGEPRLLGVPWDNWGAAVMYGFGLAEKGQSGQLVLSIKGKPQEHAVLERVIIRRYPPKSETRP